ncbi:MAG: recombination protein RecT [Oscillospiraceae bacterium]|nr:recombination protein RecT [Oscillospiraceae bacterium]
MANEGIIQKTQEKAVAHAPEKTLNSLIKSMSGEIKKALPSTITPERFTRMVLTAVRTTPGLASCEPMSFLAAMMSAAQLGLEPNTPLGQAYLLPYRNRKKNITEVQFQIGYKGLIDLAYRSGEVETVQAQCVYENDEFECEYGIEPKLRHKPARTDRGDLVSVYALFRTKSGGYGFEVMSIEDIRKHAAKYSQAYSSSYSPWKTSFEEMAKKTVIKKVLKYAPLKTDFAKAVSQDGAVKSELSEDMFEVSSDIDFVETEIVEETEAEANV